MVEPRAFDPETPREWYERIALILRREAVEALHSGNARRSCSLMQRAVAVERDAMTIARAEAA